MNLKNWLMFVLLSGFFVPGNVGGEEDFSIDSYEFEWKVATVGDANLKIVKTDETTRVSISTNNGSLRLSPDAAAQIGNALAKTAEMAKKLKGTSDKSEKVKAGDYVVDFSTSADGRFSAYVSRPGQVFQSVMLDRETAIAFSPHLKKSKAMAAYVDKKINP